jgi:hypothetical protein
VQHISRKPHLKLNASFNKELTTNKEITTKAARHEHRLSASRKLSPGFFLASCTTDEEASWHLVYGKRFRLL